MKYRRQRQQYVFAGLLTTIAVINILFYFILNRPAQMEHRDLQDSIQQLQTQVANSQQGFGNMERTYTQLERFDQDRRDLFKTHFLQRDTAYSRIIAQLDELETRTGVVKTRVSYPIEKDPQFGLYAVEITLPVQGSYNSVVNFIRELENSDTFYLIKAISVQATSDSPQSIPTGAVSLALTLETYFYQ